MAARTENDYLCLRFSAFGTFRMKKIVIIDHEPLTPRRRQIFRIEELRAAGHEVEFWDCSRLFYPGMRLPDEIADFRGRLRLDSPEAVAREIDRVGTDAAVYVVEAFDTWENRAFFRLLSDKGCFRIRLELFATATLPEVPVWKKLGSASPVKLGRAFANRLRRRRYESYKARYKVRPYDLVITSGNDPACNVRVNHPDWELYRRVRGGERLLPCPYVVFLDEFFPLHPDLLHFSRNHRADPEAYYRTMNAFFDRYEKRTGLRVVIAAHPKSDYGPAAFGGRETVKYRTVELVRDAEAVFLHSSASLTFALLFDKPLALLCTSGYRRTFSLYTQMKRISRLTGLPVCDIERERVPVVPIRVPAPVRERYIYDYLTAPGIEEESTADILCRTFARL